MMFLQGVPEVRTADPSVASHRAHAAVACTMDVANAIAVRCTTANDSVATACAAGFYFAADDTCIGMSAYCKAEHDVLMHPL
jgi:hypothetical protein